MTALAPPAPIQTFKSKFEWSVQRDAFDVPERFVQNINSNEFRASPDSEISWELRLYPRGDALEYRDYVGLFLCATGVWNINDFLRSRHRLGFISSDGIEKTINVYCDTRYLKNGAEAGLLCWGTRNFIRRDVLLDPAQDFFRDDQVVIFCDVEVHWNLEVQVPECTLSNDWSELLQSGDFSDAIIVVGGEEIKAHKLVLSARSPVFAAMFKHDMRENQTGRVEIKDLDIIAVKALLNFLYSGEVKDVKAIAEKVLPAADKYGVERLKILCEKEMCDKLKIENVVDMLSLAELHNSNQLKARALSFISLNAAEVAEQDSYWELANSNQDLLREAFGFSIDEQNSDGPQVKRRRLN